MQLSRFQENARNILHPFRMLAVLEMRVLCINAKAHGSERFEKQLPFF